MNRLDHPTKVWTTVGSAGTLNQADLAKVGLHQSIIQLGAGTLGNKPAAAAPIGHATLATLQAVVRYNVTAVDGFFNPIPSFYGLLVRFRGTITAKLMQVQIDTGVETQLIFFDSKHFPPKTDFAVRTAPSSDKLLLDFSHVYYVEATLIAPMTGDPSEISVISVFPGFDPPDF